jgi:hypothetical protein
MRLPTSWGYARFLAYCSAKSSASEEPARRQDSSRARQDPAAVAGRSRLRAARRQPPVFRPGRPGQNPPRRASLAAGIRVLFVPAFRVTQLLEAAAGQSAYVVIDDIGFTKCSFTSSPSVTKKSPSSSPQWDQIFKDPMTTMAAVDRLVHHATILEFTGDSVRANAAKLRQK